MNLIPGLLPFEQVLLVMGVLFFLVLVAAFAVLISRGKPYGTLFPFFALPIVMVGYPGLKSIEFSRNVFKIETYTRELRENPTDNNKRASLARSVANVSSRPLADPQTSVTVADGQVALGETKAAEENLKKALTIDPELPAALNLKKRIDLDRNLAVLAALAEQKPDNADVKAKLSTTVGEIDNLKTANPQTLSNLARAYHALNNVALAQEIVEKVNKINQKNVSIKLGDKIKAIEAAPK